MENVFEPILEKNEEIIKIYKPNRPKMIIAWIIHTILILGWLLIIPFAAGLYDANDHYVGYTSRFWIALLIVVLVIIVAAIFVAIFGILNYRNRYYAYTNKRIIIRSGVFGVDFKSLEYNALTATSVSVSLLDRIVNQDTGTIRFGSPSSPVNHIQGGVSMYSFANIQQPYQTLKEIKEYIDLNHQD